jgi:hypothetical protein
MNTIKLDKNFSDNCEKLMKDLPKPTTQTEEIKWHLITYEKPLKRDYYILNFKYRKIALVRESYYTGTSFYFYKNEQNIRIPFAEIIAWAKLPEGWN